MHFLRKGIFSYTPHTVTHSRKLTCMRFFSLIFHPYSNLTNWPNAALASIFSCRTGSCPGPGFVLSCHVSLASSSWNLSTVFLCLYDIDIFEKYSPSPADPIKKNSVLLFLDGSDVLHIVRDRLGFLPADCMVMCVPFRGPLALC